MYNIFLSPLRGLLLGVAYSNEDIEGIEVEEDNLRHVLQIALFIIMINVVWYTEYEED
jgi:hypothetical protein